MGGVGGRRQMVKVIVLCVAWYASSSFNNLIGKQLLMQFEYPMTLTLVQLVSITVYSAPLLALTRRYGNLPTRISSSSDLSSPPLMIPPALYWRVVVPLAVGKFIASVSSHVSIWKVPVSYAHTVKATMPLFTVVLSRFIFNERHSRSTYLSLVPIIGGVTIATLTEFNFHVVGLLSALLATLGFSLQNIFSKSVLKQTGIHQFQLLQTLAKLSLLLFLPFWALIDLRHLLAAASGRTHDDPTTINSSSTNVESVAVLLFLDGLLNFLQNVLAFSVLKLVSPLTYSVANATKRIFIIALSVFVFGNRVSPTNVLGIAIALSGVFLYNRAKHIHANVKLLPLHHNNNYQPV